MTNAPIRLYGLTIYAYQQEIKKIIADLNVPHQAIDVDLLSGTDHEAMLAALRAVNPSCSFPITVVNGRAITGFKEQEIKEAIGVRTEVDDFYSREAYKRRSFSSWLCWDAG